MTKNETPRRYGRYGEKKIRALMTLTPQALEALDKASVDSGTTRSDIVERFARGLIDGVSPQEAEILGEL